VFPVLEVEVDPLEVGDVEVIGPDEEDDEFPLVPEVVGGTIGTEIEIVVEAAT